MLTNGPASGYDLKKRFESSFGHFFAAGYGSIYPALATLARNGMVDFEEVPQEGKPDRKVYTITDKGRDELLQGLSNPSPTHKVRSEFLAIMCFAHLMTDAQIDTVIDHRLAAIDGFLKTLDALADCGFESMPPGAHFVAGCGRHVATALRQYIEDNRAMLTRRDDADVRIAIGS